MKIDEAEWTRRRKTDWVELYLQDMAKLEKVPEDWAEAAKYHLSSSHSGKVRNIRVLSWYPTHVDKVARMIDHADVWCSLEINGQPHAGLVCLGPEVTVEVIPGSTKDLLPYWKEEKK